MRRAPLLLALLLIAPFSGDAFAKKKKKKKDKSETTQEAPAAQAPAAPAPAAPAGLVLPEWVSRAPEKGTSITVLETGTGKAEPLRLNLSAGSETVMSMELDMSMGMEMAGMSMPSMSMPVQVITQTVTVDEVDADGNITYHSEVTGIDLTETDRVPAELVASLEQSLSGMVGMTTTAKMTTRGQPLSGSIVGTEGMSPEMREQMNNFSNQLENMTVPLPEEPVAPGAKWEVLGRTESGGMAFVQRVLVTLASRDGDRVELHTAIEQSLADQDFAPPGLPPGTSVDMTGFSSSGSGRTVQDLTQPVPHEGEATIELSMDMNVKMDDPSAGGMSQPFGMDMTVSTKMKRADAAD